MQLIDSLIREEHSGHGVGRNRGSHWISLKSLLSQTQFLECVLLPMSRDCFGKEELRSTETQVK